MTLFNSKLLVCPRVLLHSIPHAGGIQETYSWSSGCSLAETGWEWKAWQLWKWMISCIYIYIYVTLHTHIYIYILYPIYLHILYIYILDVQICLCSLMNFFMDENGNPKPQWMDSDSKSCQFSVDPWLTWPSATDAHGCSRHMSPKIQGHPRGHSQIAPSTDETPLR